MCHGISVPIHEIPEAMISRHRLTDRIVQRDPDAGREIQFIYRHSRPLLPVYLDNQLRIIEWGCRRGRLPTAGWCHNEWIESGDWQQLRPQRATIVAALALERGVWYQVKEGIQAVVVQDWQRQLHAYMLTEPASHYYRIMTRNNRMPILIGQTI
jgi:hypothetical protein